MSSSAAWGHGAAKPVPRATKKPWERVVFLSDLHVPFHDPAVVRAALALIRDVEPRRVVLNGDIADFFQLSRFNTGQERLDTLQEEIDAANAIRLAVREAAPGALIEETQGNHDHRIISYVQANARALTSLRALEPPQLFQYAELAITPHPGAGFLLRPHFLVKHGTLVRKYPGATARAEMAAAGISGISGHTHRLATYRFAGYGPARQWTEQGGLMRLDPDYVTGPPNWTQGLVVGEFATKGETFATFEVPYIDGALRLGLSKYPSRTDGSK